MPRLNVFGSTIFAMLLGVTTALHAQTHQEAVIRLSATQPLAEQFIVSTAPALPCLPQLSNSLPEPGPLSLGLDQWVNDPALDSKWVLAFFANDCAAYKAASVTADLYVPLVEELLVKRQLNSEYAWLPVALSGMNPSYEDLNRAGIWAIDRLTARITGLRVTRLIDERKSPAMASQAAVELLSALSKRYPNDPVRVAIAMRFGMAYADRCEPNADQELVDYLACLKVGMRLLQHTERVDTGEKWVNFLSNYEEVTLSDTLRFDAVQAVLGMHEALTAALHPWFTGKVILPDYVLPVVLLKSSARALEVFADSAYAYMPPPPVKSVSEETAPSEATTYRVRKGDVLGSIAQRYGVRVRDIMTWNNLRNDRINVGQVLTLFAREAVQVAKAAPKPSLVEDSPMAQGQSVEYTVKEGDSLWLIARNYPGVSADDIMEWNSIGTTIYPGMKLLIYLP